jgi:uncharacterized protein
MRRTATEKYVKRLAEPWIAELLEDVPAILLVGPRASGKTTTALRHARTVLRLDHEAVRGAMAADPEAVLRDAEPTVLVDEWQLEPTSLAAAKRLIDVDDSAGQFIFAGSAADEVGPHAWPATGRFIRVPLWGLTCRELAGNTRQSMFFDRVADPNFDGTFPLPKERPDTAAYIDTALLSGFPQGIRRSSERTRTAWLGSYLELLLQRDVALIAEIRDPMRLRRYLAALAASTAGIPSTTTLMQATSLNRETVQRYDVLLERLFVTEQVPAWSSNRLTRLSAHAKRYICDSALAATLLGADRRTILRDVNLLGRIIDTFVASQLRPELELGILPVTMFRQDGQREIDILLERRDGAVVAIEVKAAVAADVRDARHLIWLQEKIGEKSFRAGIVFYTGSHVVPLGKKIWVVPLCALWG